jgi:putative radical SAM enzyme (TIGR03279 family)
MIKKRMEAVMDADVKKIISVKENSIADELEIEPGDFLVSINDFPVKDIFDYMFLTEDEYLKVLIRKPDGEEWLLEIEKDEDEDLGLEFESGLMDGYKSCHNKCIFCFIDQMPPGMRDTLYFKDDDSRLSFLQGNYVTLTNMTRDDIDRVINYNMSPINISFHTTNPELRCRMLNNRFAGDVLEKAKRLADGGITLNGQIVLCRGINDKEELERSLKELYGLYPALQSISVVPVGLTKYRDGLYPLKPFDKEDALEVIGQIESWQSKARAEHGTGFVYASDEWYMLAEKELPSDEKYDGYPQLENGVGMMRLLETEVSGYMKNDPGGSVCQELSIATGLLAWDFIKQMADKICEKYPDIKVNVYKIRNDFFGERITVSGLITGQDLIKQLKGKKLGSRLIIPVNMLREGEEVFLDDVTVNDVQNALGVPVLAAGQTGADLCRAVIHGIKEPVKKRRQIYEQTDSGNRGKA